MLSRVLGELGKQGDLKKKIGIISIDMFTKKN
jgi:hypothetical protein